ncbi:MAG: Holliday junction branch migration protein RuvA [Bacteroidales bacterium]|jgi:Holliday junction DNA helicase RuvA|nr:Holliday junction branch migration protein RuvA [Bacteroidales bacterium]MDD3700912.1 Holliday junction branch migration protein RuvA [Bacteroidales bacterium]MDY0370032.1 Holliday junction branch migration protein RuvA [Bacteroidales bacterium]
MYAYLTGKIAELTPAYVILDVNGIGYHIQITLNTFEAISGKEHIKLYVHHVVRDDAYLLFGFADQHERAVFLQLITVPGVGNATARMILSSMTTMETIEAISSSDVAMLQRVKGIGAKTAQRIVVDLRDKIGWPSDKDIQKSGLSYNTSKQEALSALLVLGFNRVTADKALTQLLQQDAALSVEKLLKEALKVL